MNTEIQMEKCELEEDGRGVAYEIMKKIGMPKDLKEVMIISTKPGAKRGNHYHKTKKEWLGVISGKAHFVLLDNKTKERKEFDVKGSEPVFVNIPVNVTHTIINTGNENMVLVEISNHEYSSENTDNYKNEIA